MKRVQTVLAAMLLAGMAFAAIGDEPEVFLASLPHEVNQAPDDGYESGGIRFHFEERGGVVYRVDGEGTLDEEGIDFASSLIGQATGYGEGIAQPVAEFFRERAHGLVGQGRVPLAVEEYVLELELSGEEPHEVSFSVYLAEVPEDAFPPARHALGPDDARFVIREFSDFQCPFCARYALEVMPVLKETLLERGDVRFEYHHFPLTSIHANAQPAAEAAECVVEANSPDAFWPYHDALFERLQAWGGLGDPNSYFVRLAGDLGLHTEGVAECLENRDFADEVREATRIATNVLSLRGTPTIFVNGYRIANAFELERYERTMDLIERFSD